MLVEVRPAKGKEPETYVFDTGGLDSGDSSIRCGCGVYVQVPFGVSGNLPTCPRCQRVVGG